MFGFGDVWANYDAWKTACCERYPNCSHCGETYDEETDRWYSDEDYEDLIASREEEEQDEEEE